MEGAPVTRQSVRHRRLAVSSSSSSSSFASSASAFTLSPSAFTSSGSSSSSASGSLDVGGRSSQSSYQDNDDAVGPGKDTGTCSYYEPQFDGCSQPRPCHACLNFKVAAEPMGCMVNQVGKCVSVTSNYDPAKDFTKGNASNRFVTTSSRVAAAPNGPLYFREDKARYCNEHDLACTACRNTIFVEALKSNTAVDHTAFCYGENGCVCIAVCESTKWSELVGGTECPDHSASGGEYKKEIKFAAPPDKGIQAWEITLIAIAVLLAILILVIIFQRRRDHQFPMWIQRVIKIFRKSSKQEQASTSTTATTEISVPVLEPNSGSGSASGGGGNGERLRIGGPKREGLSLFGWRVMREELIDNETHRLARLDEGEQSPASGFVQFADTAPSAPAFDDDLSNNESASAAPSAPSFRDKLD